MDNFDFPYFRIRKTYPDDQARVRFGRGFEFTANPVYPLQTTYILTMHGMQYFEAADGSPDLAAESERNAEVLDQFYKDHRLHIPFILPTPRGDVIVRFNKPLEMPEPEIDSNGLISPFEIELIEYLS